MKRLFVLATVMLFAACSTDKQAAPALTGPSELGLALSVTASPDAITQDGHATSTIQVVALDANSQPVRGLTIRADIIVGGIAADLGTLSSKVLSTDNNGATTAIYTAPPAPPATAVSDTVIAIAMTPVGSNSSDPNAPVVGNFADQVPRSVSILLARPGELVPPCLPTVCGQAPAANFVFSPSAPNESEAILFDGTSSTGSITSYTWTFGDGGSAGGATTTHSYSVAGAYNVTLTVTDSFGRTNAKTQSVSVSAVSKPTASFTISPTNPVFQNGVTTVNFNASASSTINGRTIVSYSWDFGDGSTGSGVTPQHVYSQKPPGTILTVVLTVTDSAGQSGSTSLTLTFN